jgi:hypothetical protein
MLRVGEKHRQAPDAAVTGALLLPTVFSSAPCTENVLYSSLGL